jgi:hypothetical protein
MFLQLQQQKLFTTQPAHLLSCRKLFLEEHKILLLKYGVLEEVEETFSVDLTTVMSVVEVADLVHMENLKTSHDQQQEFLSLWARAA